MLLAFSTKPRGIVTGHTRPLNAAWRGNLDFVYREVCHTFIEHTATPEVTYSELGFTNYFR